MGYSTKFTGDFFISPPLDLETCNNISLLHDNDDHVGPGGYCQWEPSKDGTRLSWDGGEKFYDYIEWLHYIIDNILTPRHFTLRGSVEWQGDEIGDAGTINVHDNVVSTSTPKDRIKELEIYIEAIDKRASDLQAENERLQGIRDSLIGGYNQLVAYLRSIGVPVLEMPHIKDEPPAPNAPEHSLEPNSPRGTGDESSMKIHAGDGKAGVRFGPWYCNKCGCEDITFKLAIAVCSKCGSSDIIRDKKVGDD